MEDLINWLKAFGRIEKTLTSKIILAVPLLLLFIGLNLVIFVFDEQAGSVVSNDAQCAKIGKNTLKQGGSVVDAAIATMFCEGVVLPNRAGIGGGFTAILYIAGLMETVTATPIVPNNFSSEYLDNYEKEVDDAQAAGVPGELLGYWEMHRKYGLLPWRDLLQPTIELCEEGVPITEWLELDMQRSRYYLYKSPAMRQLYRTMMENREGNSFKFKALARTLRRIAKEGPKVFYNGDIGEAFIKDIQASGGVMTMDDLRSYNVSWGEPVIFQLPGRKKAYTTGLPTMGAVVAMVMNIMKSSTETETPLFWHRTIEAMKHALGSSYTLADIDNEPNEDIADVVRKTFRNMVNMDYAFNLRTKIKDDSISNDYKDYGVKNQPSAQWGTSNICIISPSGQAIVMSSSLMWDFGSFAWSPNTGIILNTQLRSFASKTNIQSLPRSPAQFIRPGKRAMTPHAPTIVLDRSKAEVFFVVGAGGSALIPSQVITALIKYCIMRKNAFIAANSGFFHPDTLTNSVLVSDAIGTEHFSNDVIDYLKKAGHNLTAAVKHNPYAIRTCIGHSHVKPDIQFTYHQQGGMEVVEPGHGFNTFLVIVVISLALWILSWLVYEIVLFENQLKDETS